MSTKLYVGNLSFQTSTADLEALFAECGNVASSIIVEDRETGRSRGFGFIEMDSGVECQNAIAALNGREIDGRPLKVTAAKPQQPRTGSGYAGGKSGFGSGFLGHAREYNKSW